MKRILLLVTLCIATTVAFAQQTKSLPSGVTIKWIKKGTGTVAPKLGDYVALIMKGKAGSEVFFDTKTISKSAAAPVNFDVRKKQYNGDIMEAFPYLREGDSVLITVVQDSFYRMSPQNLRPKGIKPGEPIIYNAKVTQVRTKKQYDAEVAMYKKQQAEMAKQQAAFAKQQKEAKARVATQDKEIKKYIADNNLGAYSKTKEGIYFIQDAAGTGETVKAGSKISANYTGMNLDGTKFDSNIDSAFGHVTPFSTKVGVGQVIQGWDKGLQLFKKGTKGKLIIPSDLAYGSNGSGANIKPNAILRFDMEVLSITTPEEVKAEEEEARKKAEQAQKDAADLKAKEDKTISDFLAANNIKATKLPSGVYVAITQEGTGNKITRGDACKINYTGSFLDGKKFDSNVDSTFNHVSAYDVTCGMGQVIQGWEVGLQEFKKGSKGKIIIPSALAYGANERPSIPANSILQFDMDVLDVTKKVDPTPQSTQQITPQKISVSDKK